MKHKFYKKKLLNLLIYDFSFCKWGPSPTKKQPHNNKREPQQAENNEHMQDSKDHSNSLPECSKSSWLKKHPSFLQR